METRNKKRLSILKRPSMSGSENSSPANEAETGSKTTKKIIFSRRMSIKEFAIDDQCNTIWSESYEKSTENCQVPGDNGNDQDQSINSEALPIFGGPDKENFVISNTDLDLTKNISISVRHSFQSFEYKSPAKTSSEAETRENTKQNSNVQVEQTNSKLKVRKTVVTNEDLDISDVGPSVPTKVEYQKENTSIDMDIVLVENKRQTIYTQDDLNLTNIEPKLYAKDAEKIDHALHNPRKTVFVNEDLDISKPNAVSQEIQKKPLTDRKTIRQSEIMHLSSRISENPPITTDCHDTDESKLENISIEMQLENTIGINKSTEMISSKTVNTRNTSGAQPANKRRETTNLSQDLDITLSNSTHQNANPSRKSKVVKFPKRTTQRRTIYMNEDLNLTDIPILEGLENPNSNQNQPTQSRNKKRETILKATDLDITSCEGLQTVANQSNIAPNLIPQSDKLQKNPNLDKSKKNSLAKRNTCYNYEDLDETLTGGSEVQKKNLCPTDVTSEPFKMDVEVKNIESNRNNRQTTYANENLDITGPTYSHSIKPDAVATKYFQKPSFKHRETMHINDDMQCDSHCNSVRNKPEVKVVQTIVCNRLPLDDKSMNISDDLDLTLVDDENLQKVKANVVKTVVCSRLPAMNRDTMLLNDSLDLDAEELSQNSNLNVSKNKVSFNRKTTHLSQDLDISNDKEEKVADNAKEGTQPNRMALHTMHTNNELDITGIQEIMKDNEVPVTVSSNKSTKDRKTVYLNESLDHSNDVDVRIIHENPNHLHLNRKTTHINTDLNITTNDEMTKHINRETTDLNMDLDFTTTEQPQRKCPSSNRKTIYMNCDIEFSDKSDVEELTNEVLKVKTLGNENVSGDEKSFADKIDAMQFSFEDSSDCMERKNKLNFSAASESHIEYLELENQCKTPKKGLNPHTKHSKVPIMKQTLDSEPLINKAQEQSHVKENQSLIVQNMNLNGNTPHKSPDMLRRQTKYNDTIQLSMRQAGSFYLEKLNRTITNNEMLDEVSDKLLINVDESDRVSTGTQYEICSYGNLTFEKTNDVSIDDIKLDLPRESNVTPNRSLQNNSCSCNETLTQNDTLSASSIKGLTPDISVRLSLGNEILEQIRLKALLPRMSIYCKNCKPTNTQLDSVASKYKNKIDWSKHRRAPTTHNMSISPIEREKEFWLEIKEIESNTKAKNVVYPETPPIDFLIRNLREQICQEAMNESGKEVELHVPAPFPESKNYMFLIENKIQSESLPWIITRSLHAIHGLFQLRNAKLKSAILSIQITKESFNVDVPLPFQYKCVKFIPNKLYPPSSPFALMVLETFLKIHPFEASLLHLCENSNQLFGFLSQIDEAILECDTRVRRLFAILREHNSTIYIEDGIIKARNSVVKKEKGIVVRVFMDLSDVDNFLPKHITTFPSLNMQSKLSAVNLMGIPLLETFLCNIHSFVLE